MKAKAKERIRKAGFTLVELISAMGVLAVIIFVLLSFFSAAQQAWTMSNARAETYENARIAMDLITRDIQCAFYVQGKVPFKHENTRPEKLYFVSATPVPHGDYNSRLCEVAYSFYNEKISQEIPGWLIRSVTGDSDGSKWDFYEKTAADAFSATSRDYWQLVIPHVVDLKFICFTKDGDVIDGSSLLLDTFPYGIRVELTLLDKASWDKWTSIDPDAIKTANASSKGSDEDDAAWEFRKNIQRTFTKTIFIGERGQKY